MQLLDGAVAEAPNRVSAADIAEWSYMLNQIAVYPICFIQPEFPVVYAAIIVNEDSGIKCPHPSRKARAKKTEPSCGLCLGQFLA
jgi:hypothetical protein